MVCFEQSEFEVMREDVLALHEAGADGFALGILKEEGDVDRERVAELMALARGKEYTFHRGSFVVDEAAHS